MPAKFIALSDGDFVRYMHPPLLQMRRIALFADLIVLNA